MSKKTQRQRRIPQFFLLLTVFLLVFLTACAGSEAGTSALSSAAGTSGRESTGTAGEPAQTSHPTDSSSSSSAPTGESSQQPPVTEDPLKELLTSKHELRFNSDGNFKILVFSDVHGQGPTLTQETKDNIRCIVDRESPDLVIFDGDNTWGLKNANVLRSCLKDMVGYIESKKIPWMHVYGNHDNEYGGLSKEKQQAVYEAFAYCISKSGSEELTGVGNYVLPVYRSDSDAIGFAVWALDSGTYISDREKKELYGNKSFFEGHPQSDYGYIHPDQIAWYYQTSLALQERNGGQPLPGLMAFHIALQESYHAWENRDALPHTGERREDVCASPVNSGLFALLAARGDIKAVVNGHDHINDFMVECMGIQLCQASTPTGEIDYRNKDLLGGRVFVIREEDPSKVETYMSYVHKRIDPPKVDPLPSGTAYDFEGGLPAFECSGFDNNTTADAHVDEILLTLAEGKGYNGSAALALSRKQWYDSNTGNNAELKWALDTPGTLGDNRYLRVWLDLSENDLDFRKAGFGLVVNGVSDRPYRTDDYDAACPFYYLAKGSNEWVELSNGSDGCFGAGDGQSVKGMKGWFAFPLETMTAGSGRLTSESVVTGLYFYFSFSSSRMAGKYFYLDHVTLVKDYRIFES